MKNIGDFIVCHKQVCKIIDMNGNYLELVPLNEESLKMHIPSDSKVLRNLLSKEEIDKLLKEIPSIDAVGISERMIENTYKELLQSGIYEDLVKIIKTAYLRNEFRKNNNKKVSDRDNKYLEEAEKYLYTEIGAALGLDYDSAKSYVIDTVSKYS